jgi:hypothetical protein
MSDEPLHVTFTHYEDVRMRIDPALTAEEWATVPWADRVTFFACVEGTGLTIADGSPTPRVGIHVERDDLSALIALANAALPDSDPRKIRREWMRELRERALDHPIGVDNKSADIPDPILTEIAAALESYLPPEGT